MFQQDFRVTPISGNGLRPSLFGGTVAQARTFHPTLASGASLGETPAGWYARAKRAIARFDELLGRTARIANQTERNRIVQWVGRASTEGTPAYRYASVKSDIQTDVEAFTPPAVNAYQVERRQNRIEKLEDQNNQFASMVTSAENIYGKLPEPVTIDRERIVTQQVGTNWTLPVAVGAGAIAVALLVSSLAGGK